MEKLKTYFVNDDTCGWIVCGDIDDLMEYIRNYITAEELKDGEGLSIELDIKRQDMTQDEIDAIPES